MKRILLAALAVLLLLALCLTACAEETFSAFPRVLTYSISIFLSYSISNDCFPFFKEVCYNKIATHGDSNSPRRHSPRESNQRARALSAPRVFPR